MVVRISKNTQERKHNEWGFILTFVKNFVKGNQWNRNKQGQMVWYRDQKKMQKYLESLYDKVTFT